jgi:hypothetical protein
MDTIQEVIHTMDKNQQKEFVYFIQRNKYRKGRKDLQLFNLLKEEKERKPAEMIKLLATGNSNAYHTIRKRLFSHLADFFILKSTSEDATTFSHVNGMLGVVNYLFDKGLVEQGWKYLLIAENIAFQNHYPAVLNTIYLLQIEKVHLQKKLELTTIIDNYQHNQEILQQEEKLQIASSIVRQQLNKSKDVGLEVDFQILITDTLNTLNIDIDVLKTPTIVLNFLKIIRAGIIAKKDFNAFEPYLINTYKSLYKNKKTNINYMAKAELLYMIAHTSYRNKKFKQSLSYLEELSVTLKLCTKPFQKQFNAKVIQLISANLIYLKELKKATENLTELYNERQTLSNEEHFNSIVNLGFYRFLNKEYKKSHELLMQLSHSDNWYKKTMGIEWVLKKNLMELVLYIELKHFDLVESRIKSIERNYESLKPNPIYKKAFDFLKLLKEYLLKYSFNIEGFKNEILNRIDFVPYEQEDIQAMTFYAWLKSKATQKDFYDTLLGLMK